MFKTSAPGWITKFPCPSISVSNLSCCLSHHSTQTCHFFISDKKLFVTLSLYLPFFLSLPPNYSIHCICVCVVCVCGSSYLPLPHKVLFIVCVVLLYFTLLASSLLRSPSTVISFNVFFLTHTLWQGTL